MKNNTIFADNHIQSLQFQRGHRSSYRWNFFVEYLKNNRKFRVLLAVVTIFSLGIFAAAAFLIASLINKLSAALSSIGNFDLSNLL